MDIDHLIKKERAYVVCSVDDPDFYLVKQPGNDEYTFSNSIKMATKFPTRDIAELYMKDFQCYIGEPCALVIIPLKISYTLVEET